MLRKIEGSILGWGLTGLFGFITGFVVLAAWQRFQLGVAPYEEMLERGRDVVLANPLPTLAISFIVGISLHTVRKRVQNAAQDAQRWMARILFLTLVAIVVAILLA